jgi:HD-GYP domain-containing protein (c-di-GMP phosphodiesterase class II)
MDGHLPPHPERDGPVFFAGDEAFEPTVLAWRPVDEWQDVHGQVVRSDAGVAELLLGLVRETASASRDETRLFEVISEFSFRAFPNATHLLLAERDEASGAMRTLIARAREAGDTRQVTLSRTIANRVMSEGGALLYVQEQERRKEAQSIVLSRLETAICAPLMDRGAAYGILQMDVRRPAKGRFTREDVDLLSVFASQVGLALEHLRMAQQQRRAFESTINALVHSLTLKDPESAMHSGRVQALAVGLGRRAGLSTADLEVLSVAALLHDLGKQGVRDELLFKPDRLTDREREEMSQHAAHTQNILDMIVYPEELRDVPRIAAYHHEKLDGTGPFGVAGDDIPLAARIISVADVCDALLSPRVYKQPLRPSLVLEILERGKGVDWDARVVDLARASFPELLAEVYGSPTGAILRPGDDEARQAA